MPGEVPRDETTGNIEHAARRRANHQIESVVGIESRD